MSTENQTQLHFQEFIRLSTEAMARGQEIDGQIIQKVTEMSFIINRVLNRLDAVEEENRDLRAQIQELRR